MQILPQSPTRPLADGLRPTALSKPADISIQGWLKSLPEPNSLARAVEQNPTAQGLIFRRQCLMTEVVQWDEAVPYRGAH